VIGREALCMRLMCARSLVMVHTPCVVMKHCAWDCCVLGAW